MKEHAECHAKKIYQDQGKELFVKIHLDFFDVRLVFQQFCHVCIVY